MFRATLLLLALALPLSAQEQIGSFYIFSSMDPLTDEMSIMAVTEELEPTIMRTSRLIFRCQGGDFVVLVSADQFLNVATAGVSSGHIPVQWRFDRQQAPPEARWSPSTDGQSAFAPPASARALVQGARRYDRLVMRLRDYSGTALTVSFDMEGATDALSRLSCAPEAP